jgi:predicted lipoprotein with Yx(FWY)xxD motif
VLPQKRIFTAAASALAATLVLAGCGSNDYGLSSSETAKLGAPAADQAAAANQAADKDANNVDEGAAGAKTGEDAADSDADKDAKADKDAEAQPPSKSAIKPVGKVTDKLISKSVPKMGKVVTDSKGWVLYRFDKDKSSPAKSNCDGDCAKLWPPILADETLELSGISANKVSTVKRADGGRQVTIDGWPVYRYIGDKTPGKWKGQNVGGVWFVVDKNGKKNLTCLPPVSKPVKLPASVSEDTGSSSADDASADDASADDASADDAYSSGGY